MFSKVGIDNQTRLMFDCEFAEKVKNNYSLSFEFIRLMIKYINVI